MKLKNLFLLFLLAAPLFPQSYYQQSKYWMASPGAFKNGLYGYDNPALLVYQHEPDLYFTWSNQYGKWNEFNQWGLFAAVPNLGFSVLHDKNFMSENTNYKLSGAVGNHGFSMGFGYGWSNGDRNFNEESSLYSIGTSIRPIQYFSLGLVGNFYSNSGNEGIVDAAIRPFGNEVLSLFGDYAYQNHFNQSNWSAGIAVEPYPGFRLTGRYFESKFNLAGRYFESKFFTVGVDLSFGRIGFSALNNMNNDGSYSSNSYGIRLGAYDRNVLENFKTKNSVVEFELNGSLRYRRFIFFDDSRTLFDLIDQIKTAKEDNSVSGIAINTSGMQAGREMLWELREELIKFKESGKKVYVYMDNGSMDMYYFASVADKLFMDPIGMLTLEGYVWGKTYFANALEKLGVGFHEWRYFKYKSAGEVLSRTSMSEGDSIQLQALVDDLYDLAKKDICKSRNINPEKYDDLINNQSLFIADDALKYGLVDCIGRWDSLKQMLNKDSGDEQKYMHPGSLTRYHLPEDNYWGEKPEIAVIYALGECAMDEGINARQLVKTVKEAGDNKNIKAIIFRVDSPGGDGLASDIVAEALKDIKGKKPVIVTQGYVAASGGYWLSMYGDTIVAAPNTITGSIGVIGGWAYNKELKDKIGFSTDYVKKGEHADLGFGMTLPFIGLSLPDRDLTSVEQKRVDNSILTMYKGFVQKVALGRNKTYEQIHNIAQGRVWSGTDGLSNGLVDVIGGLQTAIDIAVKKAGLEGKEYQLKEYPARPFINFNFLMPKLGISGFGLSGFEEDPYFKHLKFRLQNAGVPMPIIPLEDMNYIPVY